MKTIVIIVAVVLSLILLGFILKNTTNKEVQAPVPSPTTTTEALETEVLDEQTPTIDGVTVVPISHATVALEWNGTVLYTDPVGGIEAFASIASPDLILLTDIHGDHLSTSTLAALLSPTVQFVAPQAVADLLPASILERTVVLSNGATTSISGFTVEAIAMYNLPEEEDSRHSKGRGNGYVISDADTRVYVAGDTADTPEMRALTDIDIAFLPMNLPYTMSVEAAANATLDFVPKTVIPYHYRTPDGLSDVGKFRDLVNAGNPSIRVILGNWYPAS